MDIAAVILAAGRGTRMGSDTPKVLHKIAEKPMLSILLDTVERLALKKVVVVTGVGAQDVEAVVGQRGSCVYQAERLGTGHAVMQAESSLKNFTGYILVLCGDAPLLRVETLQSFMAYVQRSELSAAVLTMELENPKGYGRIVQNDKGHVVRIVEEKVASCEEKQIRLVNTGVICVEAKALWHALSLVKDDNPVKEYYLTDVIGVLATQGRQVGFMTMADPAETLGVNSREDLALVEAIYQKRLKKDWMNRGVTFVAPDLTYIAADISIGSDTVVEPFVYVRRGAKIGQKCVLRAFTCIREHDIVPDGEESFCG